ncbi:hypothetical protein PPERSA_00765 [Pseudocohnilembus persalinus]|uniref:Uncharacterized protein n=1 Tax=Pseudocohnilembus persalinus TaxID=266149 RepID=A0A0V0Q9W3_PSEPJ|nr:hypothetical protein PPERSA_00765 [Pseudocohnilembus persalinus]|eukprot:KRW98938.1 hypothetical protein PPERSA_00765 [Pseudocohnilembus persalinus]
MSSLNHHIKQFEISNQASEKIYQCKKVIEISQQKQLYDIESKYLIKLLKLQPENTNKINIFKQLSDSYRKQNKFQISLQYSQKCIELAELSKDIKLKQQIYSHNGLIYSDKCDHMLEQSNYDSQEFHQQLKMAQQQFRQSLKIVEQLIIQIQNNQKFRQEAQNLQLQELNQEKSNLLLNIANTYFIQSKLDPDFYEVAKQNYLETINFTKKTQNKSIEGKCYFQIAEILFLQKKFDDAFKFYKKDLQICQSQDDIEGYISTLQSIGKLFFSKRDYDNSLQYFQLAKKKANQYQLSKYVQLIDDNLQNLEQEMLLRQEVKLIQKEVENKENLKQTDLKYYQTVLKLIQKREELEDFDILLKLCEQYQKKILKSIQYEQNSSNQSKLQQIYQEILIIEAYCLKSSKKFVEAQEKFENLIDYLSDNKNYEYYSLKIDYASLLDEIHLKNQNVGNQNSKYNFDFIENIYITAINEIEKSNFHNSFNLYIICLKNLEIIYSENSKKSKQKEILQKLKQIKKSQNKLNQQQNQSQDLLLSDYESASDSEQELIKQLTRRASPDKLQFRQIQL